MGKPFRGDTETPSWARLSSNVVQPGPRQWVTLVSLILLWVTVSANPLCDVIFWKHEERLSGGGGGAGTGTCIGPPFLALASMDGTVCRPFS